MSYYLKQYENIQTHLCGPKCYFYSINDDEGLQRVNFHGPVKLLVTGFECTYEMFQLRCESRVRQIRARSVEGEQDRLPEHNRHRLRRYSQSDVPHTFGPLILVRRCWSSRAQDYAQVQKHVLLRVPIIYALFQRSSLILSLPISFS